MGPMTIGLYYQTEQEHQYDNLHVTSIDGTTPFTITQVTMQGGHSTPNCKVNVMVMMAQLATQQLVYVVKMLKFNNHGT